MGPPPITKAQEARVPVKSNIIRNTNLLSFDNEEDEGGDGVLQGSSRFQRKKIISSHDALHGTDPTLSA